MHFLMSVALATINSSSSRCTAFEHGDGFAVVAQAVRICCTSDALQWKPF